MEAILLLQTMKTNEVEKNLIHKHPKHFAGSNQRQFCQNYRPFAKLVSVLSFTEIQTSRMKNKVQKILNPL